MPASNERFSGFLRFRKTRKVDGAKQEQSTLLEISIVAVGVLAAAAALTAYWLNHL
jgi:hypothetical protein